MPQTAKAQNLHPKMTPFQIFQDASNSKSSKPTSQNFAFPNLPTCLKQQELKTNIPKGYLSKSSKMPQGATAQNLHPKILPFQIFQDPKTARAQNLHSKMMPVQIFQHASNSKSSKPTSQNIAFPNQSTCQRKKQKIKFYMPKMILSKACNTRKVQKRSKSLFYIPKCCLSKSCKMPQTAKAQNLHPKMVRLSKSSKMPRTAKARNLHPETLPFQISQVASNSKSSKPTSRNLTFPNLPSCLKQQKIKTYIPKCRPSKSSKMQKTAKTQNLHPKMLPFQIFQVASTSKSSNPTSPNVAFSNLPRCLKQQNLKTYTPN